MAANRFSNRLSWLCAMLGLALAIIVLALWGLSVWTILLAALLLVCPVILVWGLCPVAGGLVHPRNEP